MSLSFWLWLGATMGALIFGAITFWILYLCYDYIFNVIKLKKKIPKELNNPDFLNPGKPNINDKEVRENERIKSAKFREYEKLRRIAIKSGRSKQNNSTSTGNKQQSKRSLLQDEYSDEPTGDEGSNTRDKRDSEKGFQPVKPTDI